MFDNFVNRFQNELKNVVPKSYENDVNIINGNKKNRKLLSYTGGIILGSLETFENLAITKDEYDNVGPNIVHRKCF